MDMVGDGQGDGRLGSAAPRLDAEIDEIGRARPAHDLEQDRRVASTQDRPSAIAVSSSALPSVVPTTVASAGRTPRVAPVATTSVTIGTGVIDQDEGDRQEGGEELRVHLNPRAVALRRAA